MKMKNLKISMKIILILILLFGGNLSATFLTEIEKCKLTSHGREYAGKVSKTIYGHKCLPWTKRRLNQLLLSNQMIYNYHNIDSILNTEYCRNPTSFPNGPWCFIDRNTIEWEYCDIPFCYKERHWCKDTESGVEYFGNIHVTKSEKQCQPWNNQFLYTDNLFPDNNIIDAGNKCRNPSNSLSGPWCYIDTSYSISEQCHVPICVKETLKQNEYFGGEDYLKNIPRNTKFITLNNVYQFAIFFVSIDKKLWDTDIESKTSLWSTDYNLKCQNDFNEFQFCQLTDISEGRCQIHLVYNCTSPLRTFIFISPISHTGYRTAYELGTIYEVKWEAKKVFEEYNKKVDLYLRRRYNKNITIPTINNFGNFLLLGDNVIPYAVTSKNKVIFAISEIGQGRIGFMGSEGYVNKDFHSQLKDFFQLVYGIKNTSPLTLTVNLLETLDLKRRSGQSFTTPLIWNPHDKIGRQAIDLLLNLVKCGLRIIIGIKPWAYNRYTEDLFHSELRSIFAASGIWPLNQYFNEEITIAKTLEIETVPFVVLLSYASTNLTNAISVSDIISNIMKENILKDQFEEKEYYYIKKYIRLLFEAHLHHVRYLIPCLDNPISNNNDKKMIALINILLLNPLGNKFIAPGVSFYPGIVQSNNIKYLSVRMKLNLKFPDEVAQLGLYISPGKDVSVIITKSKSETCYLYVNYHLFDTFNRETWYKWPWSKMSISLKINELKTFSFAFGGLLSIQCKESNDNIDIILNGVIQVPMYDRRDKDITKYWNNIKELNSPWAVISSDTVVFIVPSIAIRNLARPEPILELYDKMFKEEFHVRGRSVKDTRREIISADIQILAGLMHAGYPIAIQIYYVTNPNDESNFVFNKLSIETEGRWGILHEIGHNLQNDLFTFYGTEEVTNNIFTLAATETGTGINSWSATEGRLSEESNLNSIINYINDGTFSIWKSQPFIALGTYAQLKNSFGWEIYSQVFRRYDQLIEQYKDITNEEKIQLWITETSMIAKMNLCPLYDLWRWPIGNKTNTALANLPYYLPDDFLTKRVQVRVKEIIGKYGGPSLVKREPNKIPVIVGTLKNKLQIEGDKIINEKIILSEES